MATTYEYYPGFTFFDRPDYKYLTTKKGCYPSEAFSILERGGSPIGKCGSDGIPYTSKNDLYNDPLFIISQQNTTVIANKNPALLIPPPVVKPIIEIPIEPIQLPPPNIEPSLPLPPPPPHIEPSLPPIAPILCGPDEILSGGNCIKKPTSKQGDPCTKNGLAGFFDGAGNCFTSMTPICPAHVPICKPGQTPGGLCGCIEAPPYYSPVPLPFPSQPSPRSRRLTRTELVAQQTAIRRDKVIEAKHGFEGYVNKPTYFLAGESGREHVKITPSRNVRKKKGLYDFNLRGKWGGRSDIFIKDTGGF